MALPAIARRVLRRLRESTGVDPVRPVVTGRVMGGSVGPETVLSRRSPIMGNDKIS